MTVRLFVTGTDTDVGKTQISLLLLESFRQRGLSTAALKPVAAGATIKNNSLRNSDALLLKAVATSGQSYDEINPCVFEPPIAPHLAARQQGIELGVQKSMRECRQALGRDVDVLVVEGAGGWLVPLNKRETMAGLAQAMEARVVLVVGLKLGCISHALLTAAAVEASGLELAGWVANQIDKDVQHADQIVASITQQLSAPLLGQIPYCASWHEGASGDSVQDSTEISQLAACIDTSSIL